MLHHMRLLSKSSVTYLTHEWFFSRVDFQMLFEIESFRINQQSTYWAALVVRPVIIHVDIEIVQTVQSSVAFDAVQWPKVILDLILVLAHRGVVVGRV